MDQPAISQGRVNGAATEAERTWKSLTERANHSGNSFALFLGDANRVLERLPADSIQTCLTSPPYWGARDYEHRDQAGVEDTVEEYVSNIVSAFDQVRRLLRPDGTAWLNLGDCYLHGVGTVGGKPPERGYKRNKQLGLIPFRVAIALQDRGWWVRNAVVCTKRMRCQPAFGIGLRIFGSLFFF